MIDPSIPLHAIPAKIDTPSEVATRRLTLANLGQRQVMQAQAIRDHEMQYRQRMEAEGRMRRVQEILATTKDRNLALAEIWKADPVNAPRFEQAFADQDAEAQKLRDAKMAAREKIERKIAENLVPLIGSQDVETVNKGLAAAHARFSADSLINQDPDAVEFLKQTPREVKSVEDYRNWLTSTAPEVVKAHQAEMRATAAEARAAEADKRDAAKSNAERLSEFMAAAGNAENQEQLDAALVDAPPNIKAQIGTKWSPELVARANRFNLKPQAAVPGRDVVLPEDVARQKEEIARASKGTAGGTGTLALRRIEDSEANRIKDEIDKKTKEFNRLTIEASKAWGKVNYAMALRKKGPPYPKDEDDTTLGQLEQEAREHAEDLERQKNEFYDDLVKLGAKKPLGAARRPTAPANVAGMEKLGARPGVPGAPIAPELRAAPAAPVSQAPTPPTYTEAEVRKRAKAKGLDENAAVSAARNAGLIR